MGKLALIRAKPGLKKVFCYLTGLILFYWLFIRERRIAERFEFTVAHPAPKTIWEYWADFSNYKKINPTVIDFEIDYERGTYENWEYGVTYTEHLTRLPFTVVLKGKFIVTPEQKHGHFSEPFRILSEHDTCFWIFCTHSDADMAFISTQDGKNTKVIETVTIGSPPMMTWYYLNELRTQRKYIAEQLQGIDFNKV